MVKKKFPKEFLTVPNVCQLDLFLFCFFIGFTMIFLNKRPINNEGDGSFSPQKSEQEKESTLKMNFLFFYDGLICSIRTHTHASDNKHSKRTYNLDYTRRDKEKADKIYKKKKTEKENRQDQKWGSK